jgi:hypothetical protein
MGQSEGRDADEEASTEVPLPESYWTGQELDWEAPSGWAVLWVELPFWLMVENCTLKVVVNGHEFRVDIRDNMVEVYAAEVTDSHNSAVYIGSNPDRMDPELKRQIDEQGVSVLTRPCKTVLRIHSRCNQDVIKATDEDNRRVSAHYYLAALCEAHLEIVNQVIRSYRLATYDYFPYEVSPWDVPMWRVDSPEGFVRVRLLPYAGWDVKPREIDRSGDVIGVYSLITPTDLQEALARGHSPGELELLDAINLMERGDYAGAVRRATTAIEAALEGVLRSELVPRYGEPDAEARLKQSRNDFPGRLRQYEKLSGRSFPDALKGDLETTRNMRHEIVHRAQRIDFANKGRAHRAVDTGRWIFNWLENDEPRKRLRETKLALRSIGRHISIFDARIEQDGVVVDKPYDDADEAESETSSNA